ncbi:MAG: hypothetical protein ACRC2M_12810, partial [Planktothrix sp.]
IVNTPQACFFGTCTPRKLPEFFPDSSIEDGLFSRFVFWELEKDPNAPKVNPLKFGGKYTTPPDDFAAKLLACWLSPVDFGDYVMAKVSDNFSILACVYATVFADRYPHFQGIANREIVILARLFHGLLRGYMVTNQIADFRTIPDAIIFRISEIAKQVSKIYFFRKLKILAKLTKNYVPDLEHAVITAKMPKNFAIVKNAIKDIDNFTVAFVAKSTGMHTEKIKRVLDVLTKSDFLVRNDDKTYSKKEVVTL